MNCPAILSVKLNLFLQCVIYTVFRTLSKQIRSPKTESACTQFVLSYFLLDLLASLCAPLYHVL